MSPMMQHQVVTNDRQVKAVVRLEKKKTHLPNKHLSF